jgi:mono/diheme cytochrome c family protein
MKGSLAGAAFLAMLGMSLPVHGQMGMMGRGQMMGPGHMMGMPMLRQRFVMMNGIDPRYASMTNPLPGTRQQIDSGKRLFGQRCATCHGIGGLGDGPAAAGLYPPPANVAAASKMPMASDAYLYWTIAEGGVPTGSAMPAFKESLTEGEIWTVIAYLRVL